MSGGGEVLTTRGLSVGYRTRRARRDPVLAEVDLTLRAGEVVCLLGANGTGKSTLLRTMAGLQPPLAGEVILRGTSLRELSTRARARELAIVLTGGAAVGALRGWDLVAMGRAPHTGRFGRLRAEDEAAVRRALATTGAEHLAESTVDELSDGERQRLMVARALAQEPSAVLLDEPTAFLDAPRRAELVAVLRRLARRTGVAAALSTHDVELALRNADQVWLVMPDARVVVGAPEDLVLSGALQEAFAGQDFVFDPAVGGFRIGAAPSGSAVVEGGENPLLTEWTKRALRRCGLRVAESGGAESGEAGFGSAAFGRAGLDDTERSEPHGAETTEVRVHVIEGGTTPRWKLSHPGGTSEHDSLGSLAAELDRTD